MPDGEEVHVWLIPLPNSGEYPSRLAHLISTEESERAARFIFERDRARFIVAHAALRDILARYTGQDPTALVFGVAEKGKPYLAEHRRVRFNLSHSGSFATVAMALDREVGVDIECIRPDRSTDAIAARFFAPAEVRELNSTPEHTRVAAFFACWSRKEAYIKARGEGLGIALDSFVVSLGEKAELCAAEDRERWSMCALQAPAGYAAALAAEGSGWRVKYHDTLSCQHYSIEPRSGSCRLSTAPQSHPQGEICS
jgi:4'-phosphopantetheinyl transferase